MHVHVYIIVYMYICMYVCMYYLLVRLGLQKFAMPCTCMYVCMYVCMRDLVLASEGLKEIGCWNLFSGAHSSLVQEHTL